MNSMKQSRVAAMIGSTIVLLALIGCEDPEQARLAAQRASLASELQHADTQYALAGQRLAGLERRAVQLEEEFNLLRTRSMDLERRTNAYMMSHKMAVAALAAGFAGGLAALDDSGSVTEEARAIGAVVGLIALIWAANNSDEVTEVANELINAESAMKALKQRQTQLQQDRGEVNDQVQAARAQAERLAQVSGGLRIQLASR